MYALEVLWIEMQGVVDSSMYVGCMNAGWSCGSSKVLLLLARSACFTVERNIEMLISVLTRRFVGEDLL